MKISVIIPAYNEAGNIEVLLRHLNQHAGEHVSQIIVVDGGSTDNTLQLAAEEGATAVLSPRKGRATQMNFGAAQATGDVFYFVHADTLPPRTFGEDIVQAMELGFEMGRYKTRFLSGKPLSRFNEWFTRFDLFICMGGDQTLFVSRRLFMLEQGFKEQMQLMEEYEFCQRARQLGRYKILNGSTLVSARKYDRNSWLQVQLANYRVVRMYKKGASQEAMVQAYRTLLKW